ncbi:MAG: hypothetical protein R2862_07860 [Thermoanaerobaculia bacterium]
MAGTPPPCATARLELPHGATVVGMLANLWDVRGDRTATVELRRSGDGHLDGIGALASASTTGSSGWELKSRLHDRQRGDRQRHLLVPGSTPA